MKVYFFLIAAIVMEICGTMLLPLTQNFTKVLPTVILCGCYGGAFYFLTFSLSSLPLSVVYATWSGLGVFGISTLSYFLYGQSLPWQAILGLFLIVIGVILVNLFTYHES
ncbi:MAG: QacE family quaternary ammonium compound efflux SMR transporter [Gammaproteobacteria bacterium]|nr:QacE family quaternary ammonium compound efflux SMR transporter [Gammaproteobacteria bacterium]